MSKFWTEFEDSLRLTADDKGAIRDLLGSPGWRALTHKVFPLEEQRLLQNAAMQNALAKDTTFDAGIYRGLQLAQSIPEKVVKEKKDQPESQPQRQRKVQLQREIARGSRPL